MLVKSRKKVILKCEGKWTASHEIRAHGCRLLMLPFLNICQYFYFSSYYQSISQSAKGLLEMMLFIVSLSAEIASQRGSCDSIRTGNIHVQHTSPIFYHAPKCIFSNEWNYPIIQFLDRIYLSVCCFVLCTFSLSVSLHAGATGLLPTTVEVEETRKRMF